jgi:NNP family nitrate/nitrite transporter-like MFS transporter
MKTDGFITKLGQRILYAMLGVGVLGFVIGFQLDSDRMWASFLLNAFLFLTLSLGAVVFISINRVANAGWDTAIRRVPEAMSSYLPLGSLLMLAVFFGRHSLYEGLHTFFGYANEPMTFKNAWLSAPFFFGRMATFLGLWVLLAWLIKRESTRQDQDGDLRHTNRLKKFSAIFLAVFGLTFTFASFDWLMTIEPLFYSTIYAFYVISGLLLSGFASITLLTILLQRRGLLPQANEHHLHSLGKLVFGFSTFWAYIWLCQYLLIYYANLPEETIYYLRRLQTPGWKTLFFANILLNWLIPFALLLPRSAKKGGGWLVTACVVVLVGHWVDLYVMIFPSLEHDVLLGFVDVAMTMGFASLFIQSFIGGLRRSALVPQNDPYLEESLWQEPHEAPDALAWTVEMKRAIALSTIGFAISFAVWGMISALAPQFVEMYHLSFFQKSVLIAIPVLLGSIGRLPMGVLADKFGGRIVFGSLLLFCLIPAFGATFSSSYSSLIAWGFVLGCAGTSFSIGVAFTSKWFPPEQQGTALGIYGMGNIGQSIAVFGAPALVSATGDWRLPLWLFGGLSALFGVVFLLLARNAPVKSEPKKFGEYLGIFRREPLAWILSLFYFLTFGGFVALGIYLPIFLKDIFGLRPTDAGARVAGFVIFATIMRPVGGWLADRYGGAQVLLLVFTAIAVLSLGLTSGGMLLFTIGALGTAAALGLGNGAVFKLVPQYFPKDTGTVTGLVGAFGGLGGFFPPLVIGLIRTSPGSYALGFALLSAFAVLCLLVNYFVFLRRELKERRSAFSFNG